ncbi:hypothetical protein A2982_01575 [candidate division WWE3 bacterium RIFCSPLOWO2_01_FULL_39_13]|uniref:Nucleoid-associated protein, YbaB/EbfC family n=1 Tax=candidate division WWE3 bacterium RIFCSPLOWO2_01_FULL_39_13 TaxID=1802624 RepID=A0A1F4V4N4_UNCKA|nr:MAG: hypothetical protein A2982_01575 [candidate division WWE3 bacterium RIFCSPLOWO2_01_FULL_39_13]
MFDQLSKAKDLFELKRKADAMKKEVEAISVSVDYKNYRIKMRGDQRVESIEENGESRDDLVELFNKAVKDSQKKVSKRMRGRIGDFGLPGL